MRIIKSLIKSLIIKMPNVGMEILIRIFGVDNENIRWFMMKRSIIFGKKLLNNYDCIINKMKRKKRYFLIDKIDCDFKYFSGWYVSLMISVFLFCLTRGCIPVIVDNDYNQAWLNYFINPFIDETKLCEHGFAKNRMRHLDTIKRPQYVLLCKYLYDTNSFDFILSRFLFNHFLILKEDVRQHIQKEIDSYGKPNMLGALLRGTDYLKMQPSRHFIPLQYKEFEEVILEEIKLNHYDCVYFATEERNYFENMKSSMEKRNILVCNNSNIFLGDNYYKENTNYITDTVNKCERDSVGLTYLSSMYILSKSNLIIGTNCFGLFFVSMIVDDVSKIKPLYNGVYS